MRALVRFLHVESASGVVLLLCTIVALALANSPWAPEFATIWQTRLGLVVGSFTLDQTLLFWINDGLMAIFFFVVGLEIKRELVAGELREARKAALPIMAAIGGMVAPAAIFLLLIGGGPGHSGWGVPMATDIAFVVGFLALLGPRVPIGLKILLLSLAIADDIGAILVIALFYSADVSLLYLSLAGGGLGLTILLSRMGVRSVLVYLILGLGIWLALLKSGVHPTIAGVLLGLTAPLARLESALHPWVAFGIMPLFALANAGVAVKLAALSHPVALAVAVGLVVGKPLGILLFSWLAVRVGVARLPAGVNWKVMLGAGCLAGIGFTMSLFIAGLALEGDLLDDGKIGTLSGSALSALVGCGLLAIFLRRV